MRSIRLIASGVFFLFLFSGCSLVPKESSSGPVTFSFSDSLYKSTDGGATWEVKNKGTGKANTKNINILSMAINPYDGDNVYIGLASGGILETKDAGETWFFMNNFTSEKAYGLAVDPGAGKTLYVSAVWQGRGKMFKTEDDGVTWKEIYTSPSNGPLVVSLLASRNNPGQIYATTSDKQVLKSSDGGTSWKNIYSSNETVLKVAEDATNNGLIYIITTSGLVLRSRDGGGNFEDITGKANKATNNYGNSGGTNLEADPSVSGRVYLAGSSGILVSDDAGENWRSISTLNDPKSFPIMALAINPKNSSEMICGTVQAIYKSTDGGNTWVTSQFDNKMSLRIIKHNPNDTSQIYAGFSK